MNDLVGKIIQYEDGNMEHEDVVALFQDLLNTGMVYSLQGAYHRQMQRFITAGEVVRPEVYRAQLAR